jgi:transcriptional regulator with XRE-family HTH domain
MKNGLHQRAAWNLRRIRVERGISQERLALEANVDRSYVGRLERGRENPTLAILERLARVLGVPATELLGQPQGQKPKPLPGGRRKRRL